MPSRSLLLAAAATLLLASSNAIAQPAPANPQTSTQTGDNPMCLLETLQLNNGLTLSGGFQQEKFTYTCDCADWSKIQNYGQGSPTLTGTTLDWGSNFQVWFNGQAVHTELRGNALYNDNPTSNPLATASNPWHPGTNTIQILVGCHVEADMPIAMCEYEYIVRCDKPSDTPGSVVGDPQFVGLRGQNFQVHGVSGEVYNIVSDVDLQYNAKFVFLDAGECPVVDGVKQKGCFSHPGSYLGELGLKTKAGDRIHLKTGDAKRGFQSVSVNGVEVKKGATILLADGLGSVSRNSTHLASVQVGNWDFAFENSDMFVNQKVRVIDARSLRSHGLLGQTWKDTTYANAVKHIAGKVDDYVIRDGDLFGDSFVFNQHN